MRTYKNYCRATSNLSVYEEVIIFNLNLIISILYDNRNLKVMLVAIHDAVILIPQRSSSTVLALRFTTDY